MIAREVHVPTRYPLLVPALFAFTCLPAIPSNAAVKGRANATYANMPSQGIVAQSWCDTGWLDSAVGGSQTSYYPLLSLGDALRVNSSYSDSQGDECSGYSTSYLTAGWVLKGSPAELTWDSIYSSDDDTCCNPDDVDDIPSTIANLKFGGVAITPSGATNETFVIPGVATLVVNESHHDPDNDCDNDNSEHRALHLTLVNGEEVILGNAKFDSDNDCCTTKSRSSTWGKVKSLYR